MNKIIECLRRERDQLAWSLNLVDSRGMLFKATRDRIAEIDMEIAELEREEAARPESDGEFSDHPPVGFGEMC